MGNRRTISLKTGNSPAIWCWHPLPTPWYPTNVSVLYQRDICSRGIFSSSVHGSQNLESTKTSIIQYSTKNGMLLSYKKHDILSFASKLWELENIM